MDWHENKGQGLRIYNPHADPTNCKHLDFYDDTVIKTVTVGYPVFLNLTKNITLADYYDDNGELRTWRIGHRTQLCYVTDQPMTERQHRAIKRMLENEVKREKAYHEHSTAVGINYPEDYQGYLPDELKYYDIDVRLIEEEAVNLFARFVNTEMSDEQGTAFRLVFEKGYEIKEAARMMNCNNQHVYFLVRSILKAAEQFGYREGYRIDN